MSDGETVEVEVSDEVTPQDAIRNMMDKWPMVILLVLTMSSLR